MGAMVLVVVNLVGNLLNLEHAPHTEPRRKRGASRLGILNNSISVFSFNFFLSIRTRTERESHI